MACLSAPTYSKQWRNGKIDGRVWQAAHRDKKHGGVHHTWVVFLAAWVSDIKRSRFLCWCWDIIGRWLSFIIIKNIRKVNNGSCPRLAIGPVGRMSNCRCRSIGCLWRCREERNCILGCLGLGRILRGERGFVVSWVGVGSKEFGWSCCNWRRLCSWIGYDSGWSGNRKEVSRLETKREVG